MKTVIILGAIIIAGCVPAKPPEAGQLPTSIVQTELPPTEKPTESVIPTPTRQPPSGWAKKIIAEGLYVPWSVVFPSDGRILVSERNGAVREIVNGTLNPEPIYTFQDVASQDEAGLMGLALHPQYSQNGYLYACYTTSEGSSMIDRVVRLFYSGETMVFDKIILDGIPAAKYHDGCRLKFGPDGMLYVTTGDALQKDLAQDLNSLAGKILRVDDEGNIPFDSPFSGSAVYSFGHRNSQGLSWDAENGRMYATEHGPSGYDGSGGGDEINLIVPGGNYGWPLVSHDEVLAGTQASLIQFTPAEAPGSALFYDSETLPFFTNSLLFGALRGEGIIRVVISEDESGKLSVSKIEKILNDVGRVRDVVEAPDGSIYFTTSNRDGRGQVQAGDDKVFRIYPIFN